MGLGGLFSGFVGDGCVFVVAGCLRLCRFMAVFMVRVVVIVIGNKEDLSCLSLLRTCVPNVLMMNFSKIGASVSYIRIMGKIRKGRLFSMICLYTYICLVGCVRMVYRVLRGVSNCFFILYTC